VNVSNVNRYVLENFCLSVGQQWSCSSGLLPKNPKNQLLIFLAFFLLKPWSSLD